MNKLLLSLILVLLSTTSYANGDAILGDWLTAEGTSKVNIYRCGNKYCGKITWLKEPVYPADDDRGMAGKPKIDRDNPNSSLKNRPLLNLEMLSGFEFAGGNEWEEGKIYDPKKGKTYSCIMTLSNTNTLNVRGYIGFSLIGRTTTWTRAQ
ncbi:MAG: DUF2147 domain-containing protein [Gammaproteobacteria bacterium]|nr:DUF2147 domain-containing protein [Gammaproteobacteria bacterium]MDH5694564.1 DUF2147 domain-containing protein [Gammaproteobacteria bacterium]